MRRRIVPMIVAIVALISTVACNAQQAQQEAATPTPVPTPIVPTKPTYTVQKGEVVRQAEFTGRIGPVKEVELFFKVAGRVRNVKFQRDDQVKQGDLIADLEIEPLERQVAQAELDLERVKVSLERAQKENESAIARSQIELSMRQQDYLRLKNEDMEPQRIQADNALATARLDLNSAQAAYDAAPAPGRSGSPQAMALERATLSYQSAKAAYDATIAQITTDHQQDIDMAAKQVALANNSLDSLKEGVNPLLVNDVQRADLALTTLKAQVSDAEIVAPFDGRITSLRVSPGSPVEAWVATVVVADPSSLEVNGDPATTVLTDLKEGLPVTITLVSVPDLPMVGKIRQLPYPYGSGGAKTGDTTTTDVDKSTRVSIDPESQKQVKLVLGDLARVTVILEKKTGVLWLPPQAVRTFEGRRFVVIQDGSGQRRVDVKVGISSTDRVEIEDGLQEGQVAVAP